MVNGTKKSYKAPALEKGLKIIELLSKEKSHLSMGDIAAKLNYSKNEIFRMLFVLEENKYIKREKDSDLFSITHKIFSIGMNIQPSQSLIEIILPKLRSLSNEIRQSCHIAVLNKAQSVVIARVESPASIGFSIRAGHTSSAHNTASGMVLMALEKNSNRQKEFLKIIKKEHDSQINEKEIAEEFDEISKQGYCIKKSYFNESITDIAVPIYNNADKTSVIATICVPFIKNENYPIKPDEALDSLIKVAKEINLEAEKTEFK